MAITGDALKNLRDETEMAFCFRLPRNVDKSRFSFSFPVFPDTSVVRHVTIVAPFYDIFHPCLPWPFPCPFIPLFWRLRLRTAVVMKGTALRNYDEQNCFSYSRKPCGPAGLHRVSPFMVTYVNVPALPYPVCSCELTILLSFIGDWYTVYYVCCKM